MEKSDEPSAPDIVNHQLAGQSHLGITIPVLPVDCTDEAPC